MLIGIAVPFITFVLLTVVGCDLRTGDIRSVWRRPRILITGLLVPPLALPILAVALIAWSTPPAALASGLLLIAICPVGGISNTFTYLARGSTALSITLTALSCVLAFLTMPALGALMGHLTPTPPVVPAPSAVLLAQLLAAVAVPVTLGAIGRQRWPRFADDHRVRVTMQRTGFALLALLLASIILADTRGFVAALGGAVPLAAAFIAGSVVVGAAVGRLVGADVGERIALTMEFATRNVAVATTLAIVVGRIELAAFATTYFLTELPLMLIVVAVLRVMAAKHRVGANAEHVSGALQESGQDRPADSLPG
jgi:BASS family bile acid:Na+ symporter